nr:hypothetical protein Iba_chr09cCG10920 [Ipomoea batatas]
MLINNKSSRREPLDYREKEIAMMIPQNPTQSHIARVGFQCCVHIQLVPPRPRPILILIALILPLFLVTNRRFKETPTLRWKADSSTARHNGHKVIHSVLRWRNLSVIGRQSVHVFQMKVFALGGI